MSEPWAKRLEEAGFRLVADGPSTWVIEGPQWVRAVALSSSVLLEAPVGRITATAENLVRVAQHGQVWGLGRLFLGAGQVIAQVTLPCSSPDEVSPDELQALYQHLLQAVPVLLHFGVPEPLRSDPPSDAEIDAVCASAQLHTQRHAGRWLVPIDLGRERFSLWLTVDGSHVRFDAVPEQPVPTPDPAMLDLLNQATTVGSVAPSTDGRLAWTYALPGSWLRDRPDRLRATIDHAVDALVRVWDLPPVRAGIMLPRLVAATEVGEDSPLPSVCADPRAPRVVVVPVAAETLEVIPVQPTAPWPLPHATAALAERVVPWVSEGGLLRCRGPFAAEQVLIAEVLNQAHRQLGASTLALAVPHGGSLVAAVDSDALGPFLEGATLCGHVLWVQDGQMLGLF